jgi:hypothetical protein
MARSGHQHLRCHGDREVTAAIFLSSKASNFFTASLRSTTVVLNGIGSCANFILALQER